MRKKSSRNTIAKSGRKAGVPDVENQSPEVAMGQDAPRTPDGKTCSVPNCGRAEKIKGLCSAHYQRLKNSGSVRSQIPIGSKSGELNPKWRGGEVTMPDGRVLIYSPNHPNPGVCGLYVLRYRLVMEKVLGRYLTKDEIVHHRNEIVWDDRPENLLVTTFSQHATIHNANRKRNSKGQYLPRS